ncbi:MAG: sulfite exporter TauE/SafE family protein [Pirellulales bacterium]
MLIVFVGALLIGLTLGLLGSGGSAITVPVLVYLVGHGTKESITESMAIVGLISIAAAIPYAKARQIDWRSVWNFGIPGMFGTLFGAWLGGIASDALQLIVLGSVLSIAAVMMIREPKRAPAARDSGLINRSPIWKIAMEGTVVGIVTGFVGIGGGFLIVPALVVMGNLPMRLAIGTSLAIIVIKAAVGFAKYEHYLLAHDLSVDMNTILIFSAVGVFSSQIGRQINTRLNQMLLRQVFAGFLILLGAFVIVREVSHLFASKPTVSASRDPATVAPFCEIGIGGT